MSLSGRMGREWAVPHMLFCGELWYLGLAVQEADGLVIHLQQHLLCPDLLFGVEQDEFPDGIIHRHDGLTLVHDEGGQVLELGGGKREKQVKKAWWCV